METTLQQNDEPIYSNNKKRTYCHSLSHPQLMVNIFVLRQLRTEYFRLEESKLQI